MNLLAQGLHAIAATLWIGGIFFALIALRPAAQELLQPEERLRLWQGTYRNFFRLVWLLISILIATGYYQLFFRFGGFANSQPYLHLMHTIGLIMVVIFFYIYFGFYGRLCRSIDNEDMSAASDLLKKMRPVMTTNLFLGIAITAVGVCGPYVSV